MSMVKYSTVLYYMELNIEEVNASSEVMFNSYLRFVVVGLFYQKNTCSFQLDKVKFAYYLNCDVTRLMIEGNRGDAWM